MDSELAALVAGWTSKEIAALGRFLARYGRFQNRMASWIERGGRVPVAPEIPPPHRRSEILMTILRAELCPHN